MQITDNRKIVLLGIFTIVFFPLAAYWINYFFVDAPFLSIFNSKRGILIEILVGVVTGVIGGIGAWKVTNLDFMLPVKKKYQEMFASFRLNILTIIFISFCAGIGEEIFFRGVLQQFLGIWLTAILFVAIHGYLSPKNWRISVYGGYMTLVIALLGYFTQIFGLTTAIIAHTFVDIVLFYQITNKPYQETTSTL